MNPPRKLKLKQYFTDAEHINALMCQLLGSVEGLSVLEPSVGHGALLKGLLGAPAMIDAIDIDQSALNVVQATFPHKSITLHHCDFIDIATDDILADKHPSLQKLYDAVISNPPYGLPLSVEYRRQLKKQYPHLYVKESYGLFFVFAISQLKPNGRYVFLIPDTFLTSKNHTPLRDFICAYGAPTHIIRFPSKKFETVNFGYGNLCIIAGTNRELDASDEILWIDSEDPKKNAFDSEHEIPNGITGEYFLQNIKDGWSSTGMARLPSDQVDWTTLGELAECRTGIYTGDNVQFIGFDPRRVKRRLNGHPIDWDENVHVGELNEDQQLHGLTDSADYVPLIRGGHRGSFEQTASAIKWSKEAINYYKTDKKARFQNSKYYFREGLSLPMVSSGRISAAMMRNSVFDQGVVGIFPNNRRLIAPLLLYLNSALASKLMKGLVNGSANNSANYVKKLPIPAFNEEQINRATDIVSEARAIGALCDKVCDIYIDEIVGKLTIPGMKSN